jgi:hypothetical protein
MERNVGSQGLDGRQHTSLEGHRLQLIARQAPCLLAGPGRIRQANAPPTIPERVTHRPRRAGGLGSLSTFSVSADIP